MNLVEKATLVAITAHEAVGQKRKFSGTPYWHHPCAVADQVSRHSDNEALIAAGWLHDVVEDTHLDIEHIRSHFGATVALHVLNVTKQEPYGEDDSRNVLHEIKRLMGIRSDSQLLKLCDIRCNIEDMTPACGVEFVSDWLAKKFAVLVGIKQATPEHAELCDEIITLARLYVRTHFPQASIIRIYGNGVNLLAKAMHFNPDEGTTHV